MNGVAYYQSCFNNLVGTDALLPLRQKAIEHFTAAGFPTTKDEEWAFTNIAPLTRINFALAESMPVPVVLDDYRYGLNGLVFVDGHFALAHSHLNGLSAGVRVERLSEAIASNGDLVSGSLGQAATTEDEAFTALNTAFLQDGAVVYLPRGAVVEQPIHLLFVSTGQRTNVVSHPRVLVVAEANTQATIVESYVGLEAEPYLTNSVSEFFVGPNAVLDHYRVQRESAAAFHIAATHVREERAAQFRSTAITLGGRLTRHHVHTFLVGEGVDSTLNGLYIEDGAQHVDNHTLIEHAEPHCQSHEFYKGILGGRVHRRLPRQDPRAPSRAKNRRLPDQPKSPAVGDGPNQHQAPARNLRRRRQVFARSHHRPARRRRPLLLAFPWHRPPRGRPSADASLCRRSPRPRARPHSQRPARPASRSSAGPSRRRSCSVTVPLDVAKIRRDFPILGEKIRGKDLVYFDNGATTQKPLTVIYALQRYYAGENSNIHRGVHFLSQQATFAYERARGRVGQFINARESSEVVFVRGTTEALNLVAHSYGRSQLGPDDEIIVSQLEHHSNIVPWQMLCEEKGARLRVVPISDAGEFLFDEYERLLSERTRIVAVAHASNALGTILPVKEIVALAHQHGAVAVVDGAQGVPHLPVDVQYLDCDFYAFSGHKLFGPTGIGVLYGKQALLHAMPPYEGGGSMIEKVSFAGTTYAAPPARFEAGTPHIAGGMGLEAAIDYVNSVGREQIAAYEADLLAYADAALADIPGLRLIGTARERVAVLSFTLGDIHPHDIGTVLDAEGIAVRAGHHCAQPTMQFYQVPATVRASLAFYNTHAEIDALVAALHKVKKVFGG